jgi:hypothetical protein
MGGGESVPKWEALGVDIYYDVNTKNRKPWCSHPWSIFWLVAGALSYREAKGGDVHLSLHN